MKESYNAGDTVEWNIPKDKAKKTLASKLVLGAAGLATVVGLGFGMTTGSTSTKIDTYQGYSIDPCTNNTTLYFSPEDKESRTKDAYKITASPNGLKIGTQYKITTKKPRLGLFPDRYEIKKLK